MARRYTSHPSGLLLLELIMAILFFSVASAICVQLFVKSHLLSIDAQMLSVAVNECSDAAEIILSCDHQEELLKRLSKAYPEGSASNEAFSVSYNENYILRIQWSDSADSKKIRAYISFFEPDSDRTIYHLNITH